MPAESLQEASPGGLERPVRHENLLRNDRNQFFKNNKTKKFYFEKFFEDIIQNIAESINIDKIVQNSFIASD